MFFLIMIKFRNRMDRLKSKNYNLLANSWNSERRLHWFIDFRKQEEAKLFRSPKINIPEKNYENSIRGTKLPKRHKKYWPMNFHNCFLWSNFIITYWILVWGRLLVWWLVTDAVECLALYCCSWLILNGGMLTCSPQVKHSGRSVKWVLKAERQASNYWTL